MKFCKRNIWQSRKGNVRDRIACWIGRRVRDLGSDTRGGMAVLIALTLPVAIAAVGVAIDYGYMSTRKAGLQAAADAAALAGASEMLLANADEDRAKAVSVTVAKSNLLANPTGITISTNVTTNPVAVSVAITQSPGLFIMGEMFGSKKTDITVHATARVAGEMAICMLILDEAKKAALAVNKSATITANGCAVYSNSASATGIVGKDDSLLDADLICSAGGYDGEAENFNPQPLTDCPVTDDPLFSRPPPVIGPCLETNLVIDSGMRTLNPGTYCGGLTVRNTADVKLNPGVYIIKDGVLQIGGSARFVGENVGFYITGSKANFNMLPNTTIDLSAPKDGPMAGLLFFEDRNAPLGRRHVIRSNDARSFIGTIYLPRGAFVVDASKPLFEESAYTVIISRFLDMFSGPNLVLNSNYGDSDVPLPSELQGSTGVGDEVVLTQ